MKLSDDVVDSLVVAVLATYSYSLEKAWALRNRLREAGLCDPGVMKAHDPQTVGNLLKKAGYDRGGITYIIAPRVVSLMGALDSGRLGALADHLASNNRTGFIEQLGAVKGFGPKSTELAWALAGGA